MKPKYKDIQIFHPSSNKECKTMLLELIKTQQAKKNLCLEQKNKFSFIHKLSKPIESLIRQIYSSERNRFLLYSVIYKKAYIRNIREIDLVSIEDPNTITIGEVKLTSNSSRAIREGSNQLEKSSEILRTNFTNVKCRLFIIDLLDHTDELIDDSFLNHFESIKKDNGFEYELIRIPAILLLKYVMQNNIDFYGYEELFLEAIEEATRNFEKRMQHKIEKLNARIDEAIKCRLKKENKKKSESKLIALPNTTFIDYPLSA